MLRCGSFSKLILRLWMYVMRWFQQGVVLFQTTVCLMINCGHASFFLLPVGSVGHRCMVTNRGNQSLYVHGYIKSL